MKKTGAYIVLLVLLGLGVFGPSWANSATAPFRILHVMSYHQGWKWNRDQLTGFKAALSGVNVSIRVVELDTKRNSQEAAIQAKADQAHRIIQEWQPHLLYANDDHAQAYVSKRYVGSDLPIVFSAINRDPSEYDFLGAKNVTGILEHEHFGPTINLLRRLAPDVRKIAVFVDADPTWKGVMGRMRSQLRSIPNLEVTDWLLVRDFEAFKEKVLTLQDKVDAIAPLGIFNFKDAEGRDVDYETVLKWLAYNSKLPDFAFWSTRVERGTLCAVSVSGYEQGFNAGSMAKRILVEGVSPGAISVRPTHKGEPMISLARARKLGLNPSVEVLLNVNTKTDFIWDR
ncbi:MAG: ABC transporter substrate-binding protein [Gammaproteobacteria bacterium]